MEALTGRANPFDHGKVELFEYDREGRRRKARDRLPPILFDDSVQEIATKVNSGSPGACWWLRCDLSSTALASVLKGVAVTDKLLKAVAPDLDQKERQKLRSTGGIVHVCPYLTGVFNAAVQCSLSALPHDPQRKRAPNERLWSMTDILEVHFIPSDQLAKCDAVSGRPDRYAHVATESNKILKSHPSALPAVSVGPGNVAVTTIEMRAKVPRKIDPRSVFQSVALSSETFAAALVDSGGESAVRVLEDAVRDEKTNVDKLRELSTPPAVFPYIAVQVQDIGRLTIDESGSLDVAFDVRDPTEVASAWTRAMSLASPALGIGLENLDPDVSNVSMMCTIPVRGNLAQKRLSKLLRTAFVQYLEVATASDGAIEVTYKRSPGPPRFPACVEHVLASHVRGQRSLESAVEVIVKSHSVEEARAREMASEFNVRLFRTHPPASARISTSNGLRILLVGTNVHDVHRTLFLIMHAVSRLLGKETSSADVGDQPAIRNVADIAGEAESDDMQAGPSTPASQSNAKLMGPTGIDGLVNADPELFRFRADSRRRTYARSCGPHRQPIAVTDAELVNMGKNAPDSRKTGPRQLNYICPEVWCEGTRTAMTREQAKLSGWRCPDGDVAVDLMRAAWWRGAATRKIGYLRSNTHPDGYPMPCCFKNDGHMQVERRNALRVAQAGEEIVREDDGGGRYVMSASNVPLDIGRKGEVHLGAQLGITKVLRVGVDQKKHTFLNAAAVIESVPMHAFRDRLLASLTPTAVASAASGSVMSYLLSQTYLDLRADGSGAWFARYARSDKGSARLGQRGLRYLVSNGDLDLKNPEVVREAVIAHAYERAVELIMAGRNVDTRMVQLLVLAVLGKRYPELTVSGGETYISCIRWDERLSSGKVVGLMIRDGKYLEPLVDLTKGMLEEVSAVVASSCGSHVRTGNMIVLEYVVKSGHIITEQVCDEAHIGVGMVLEGDFFLPLPVPNAVDPVLPIVYVSELRCADARWDAPSAKALFEGIAGVSGERMYRDAVFGEHSIHAGDFVIPLRGGEFAAEQASVRARIVTASNRLAPGSTGDVKAYDMALSDALSKVVSANDSAYTVLTSPLSPLTSQQKQALFTSLLSQHGRDMEIKLTDTIRTRVDEIRTNKDEIYITDQDFADGTAELALGRVASGSDSAFITLNEIASAAFDGHGVLDMSVEVPRAARDDAVNGRTSTQGSLNAISFVVALAGGSYTATQHARLLANRALLQWRMNATIPRGWPNSAKPLLQRASDQNRGPSWSKLMLLAQSIEPSDEDVALAFANVPVELQFVDGQTKRITARSSAPFRVVAWRAADASERIAFAVRRGSPLLTKPVSGWDRGASPRVTGPRARDDSSSASEK